jgi:FkbM family methyltransferase
VHALLRRFGFDLVRYGPVHFRELRRLETMRSLGIDLVLDVGANAGQWAIALRQSGYRGRIVSFEPVSGAFAALEEVARADPAWQVHRLALGDSDGGAKINVAGNSWSSSLLGMEQLHLDNAPESRYVGTEEVKVVRLDSLRDEVVRSGERVFLKLDVQGYELPVLHGAERTLSSVAAIETELSFAKLYTGQALLPELVAELHTSGFDLVSVEPNFADVSTAAPLQADGLFLRRTGR